MYYDSISEYTNELPTVNIIFGY